MSEQRINHAVTVQIVQTTLKRLQANLPVLVITLNFRENPQSDSGHQVLLILHSAESRLVSVPEAHETTSANKKQKKMSTAILVAMKMKIVPQMALNILQIIFAPAVLTWKSLFLHRSNKWYGQGH
jgi:hypothetical protein